MDREQELRALMAALARKSQKVLDSAKAESRDVSEDETKRIEAWAGEHAEAKAELDGVLADKAKKEDLAKKVAAMSQGVTASQGRKVPADAGVEFAVSSGQKVVAEDDPKRGYAHARFFLEDVMAAAATRKVPEKLAGLQINAAVGSDEHGRFSDPYGGFLLPEGFSPNLLTTSYDEDPMGSRTTKIPMATQVVKIPARVDKVHTSSVSGGLQVVRRAEADTVSATQMQLEQVRLEAESLMGISYVTEELLRDSPMSFAALLEAGFADEFRSKLATERISGTGVGEYEGIDNSGSLITVAKESSQASATIVLDNVLKMRARAWRYGDCIWMANQTCLPQLCKLTIDNGTSVVPIYHFSMTADAPDMLMGRPIFYTEECAALGTAGDIRLVNWSQYLEGVRTNPTGTSSIHVRFINNERTFRFMAENAGACWWRSALTPKNGDTLSPNVRLAAR